MKKFFTKPFSWAGICAIILTMFFVIGLLDTFVIPRSLITVSAGAATESQNSTQTDTQAAPEAEAAIDTVITEKSYEDENMKIVIETVRKYESTIYIADIQVSEVTCLKTALAGNTYGRNVKATTSEIAAAHNAVFAINGDYYGFRDDGYVLRNGVVYRGVARSTDDDDALVIDKAGTLSIVDENSVSLDSINGDEVWQVLSFGPGLIENGQIVVDSTSETSKAKTSNPRTAIGQISPLHYVVIVSDGRTSESAGISLLELAQLFKEQGCITAYNLDGGGSSTMYFNGEVINNPTNGREMKEREVSDIVYFGY